jgi:hypothetical protein
VIAEAQCPLYTTRRVAPLWRPGTRSNRDVGIVRQEPGATMPVVRRFSLAVIVVLLSISASGLSSLVVPEPCGFSEPVRSDNDCPPTCVTCGCCAQAAEPAMLAVTTLADVPIAEVVMAFPQLPLTDPRDILHVPKPRIA